MLGQSVPSVVPHRPGHAAAFRAPGRVTPRTRTQEGSVSDRPEAFEIACNRGERLDAGVLRARVGPPGRVDGAEMALRHLMERIEAATSGDPAPYFFPLRRQRSFVESVRASPCARRRGGRENRSVRRTRTRLSPMCDCAKIRGDVGTNTGTAKRQEA
jgi:hypothetical protein